MIQVDVGRNLLIKPNLSTGSESGCSQMANKDARVCSQWPDAFELMTLCSCEYSSKTATGMRLPSLE